MSALRNGTFLMLCTAAWLAGGCPEWGGDIALGDELKRLTELQSERDAMDKALEANLANFDDLDFNVFTNQKWDELRKSHAADIKVHWPDGHTTEGLEKHVEDLRAMFVYAPDTRITEHPIKVAQGDWTAVIGVMEGTFSQPMPVGDGKTIPPTGKAFKVRMATFGHWKDGVMTEEYLFWDNQEFMKQLGLGG